MSFGWITSKHYSIDLQLNTYVRHGHDDNMLLVVEFARAEIELEAKEIPFPVRHDQVPAATDRISNQLNDIRCDGDTRIAKREEHVNSRTDGTENQADDPGANGVGRDVDIIISDNRSHL